ITAFDNRSERSGPIVRRLPECVKHGETGPVARKLEQRARAIRATLYRRAVQVAITRHGKPLHARTLIRRRPSDVAHRPKTAALWLQTVYDAVASSAIKITRRILRQCRIRTNGCSAGV